MRRGLLPKSDVALISQRTGEALGVPAREVQNEVLAYWITMGQFFNHAAGYSAAVPHLGLFRFRPSQVSKQALVLERRIRKGFKMAAAYDKQPAPEAARVQRERVNGLITDVILLDYTCKSYERNVLHSYPDKPKVDRSDLDRLIQWLEKLLSLPLASYPLTIAYPVQAVFVQQLRQQGLLRNPVVQQDPRKTKPAAPARRQV